MCLEKIDKEKTKEFKNSSKKIIVYKLLDTDNTSLYKCYKWKVGLNISSRNSTELTEKELEENRIHEGFHFFLEKPEDCPYRYRNLCQCLCRYPCLYRCRYQYNKLVKFEIDPKDIVAVGTGSHDALDLVATKATLID